MENPQPKKKLWEVGWIKRVRIRSMIPLLLKLTRSKLAAGHWERGTLRGKESMVVILFLQSGGGDLNNY